MRWGGGRVGDGYSRVGYLAVFVSDVENVAPDREFVDVGADFEGETKERRKGHRS